MADPSVIDLKKATIYLIDGATTPAKLEIKMDEGNLTFTRKFNREYRKNRGLLDTVRDGDEEPLEVSFTGRFSSIVSDDGESITVEEFLTKAGRGSALVTTATDACAPYACDILVEIEQECGTLRDEVHLFEEFRVESLGGDYKAGQLSVAGKCNRTKVTAYRTALA